MTEQHVEHEPGAVAEGEDEAERFAGEADVGEHGDAGGGKGERERVAAGADAEDSSSVCRATAGGAMTGVLTRAARRFGAPSVLVFGISFGGSGVAVICGPGDWMASRATVVAGLAFL